MFPRGAVLMVGLALPCPAAEKNAKGKTEVKVRVGGPVALELSAFAQGFRLCSRPNYV